MAPTSEWGPKLKIDRIQARAPVHTDSKIPLAGPITMGNSIPNQ